ncbi:hypothetical protein SANTM175S_02722 [Streptomyces antimycoticus]
MRGDDPAVGEQLAGVLEEQETVAQARSPAPGWLATTCAASRSELVADGHFGVCVHSESGSRVVPVVVVVSSWVRMGSPAGTRARRLSRVGGVPKAGRPWSGRPT